MGTNYRVVCGGVMDCPIKGLLEGHVILQALSF
jgi:hypothetical protein